MIIRKNFIASWKITEDNLKTRKNRREPGKEDRPMKKIERLEQENKMLRDMLSDIQISIQKFEEDTATGEGHVLNAFKTLGSIAYVAGSFPSRMDEQRSLTVRKAPRGGQT